VNLTVIGISALPGSLIEHHARAGRTLIRGQQAIAVFPAAMTTMTPERARRSTSTQTGVGYRRTTTDRTVADAQIHAVDLQVAAVIADRLDAIDNAMMLRLRPRSFSTFMLTSLQDGAMPPIVLMFSSKA
jgi:hypothetical protein